MAKRKPPSQRTERQLDETAKAIAQGREAAKAEKPTDGPKSSEVRPQSNRLASSFTSRKVVAPPAFPSTKRPKKG